jgi:hypothetical protein
VVVLARIALACGDVCSLVAATVLGRPGLVVRSGMVERTLTQAPGDQYERFAVGRTRLVPVVCSARCVGPRPVRPGQGDAIRAAVAATVV